MWNLENGSEEPIQGKNRDAHIENRCADMGVCVWWGWQERGGGMN